MSLSNYDVAVIGGGMAGLTAAYHAAFAGVSVGLFRDDMDLPGGLVANVGEIDGFPVGGPIGGVELALKLTEAGEGLGVAPVSARIEAIETQSGRFNLKGGGKSWGAKRVIVASGARLRRIQIPGAEKFQDRGVLDCAWCNGSLYRGQDLVVLGGGDSALQEALHLTDFASQVTIVTHGDDLRARKRYVSKAAGLDKIQFRWGAEPLEVLGGDNVEAIRLKDTADGSVEDVPCAAIFVFIGLDANSDLVGALAKKDQRGFVETNDRYETATSGLYAVGAVRSGYQGRLTNAVGEATAAAINAASEIA